MTISPSKFINTEIEREVGCLNCNYIIMTRECSPKCENCGQPLVRVLYSIFDGHRITGDELGKQSR